MNTNSHGSPILSESKSREETGEEKEGGDGVSELSARWRSTGEVTGAREDGRRWSMESGGDGGLRMRERGSEREQTARRGRNGD